MRRWQKILIGVLATFMLIVGTVVGLILWLTQPTSGERIANYAQPKAAVLVVDIQEDFTGPNAMVPYRDGKRIVDAANKVVSYAETHGLLVAYVQNVVSNPLVRLLAGGANAPGAPGTQVDRRIMRPAGTRTFDKHRGDAFSNPELDAFLRSANVDRIYIVGLDAKFCINSTARGALNRGYKVTMLLDGIATEHAASVAEFSPGWAKAGASISTVAELTR